VPLRGRSVRRRPGQLPGPVHACLSPVTSSTITAPGRAHRPSEILSDSGVLQRS
jgi:hypothetical protein